MFEDAHVLADYVPVTRFLSTDQLNGSDPQGTTEQLNIALSALRPGQTLIFPNCFVLVDGHQGHEVKAGAGTYRYCLKAFSDTTIRGTGYYTRIGVVGESGQDMSVDDPGVFGIEDAQRVEIAHMRLVQPRYNRKAGVEAGGAAIKGAWCHDLRLHDLWCVDGHNGPDVYRCRNTWIWNTKVRGAARRDAYRDQGWGAKIWACDAIADEGEEINMGFRLMGWDGQVWGCHAERIHFEAYIIEGGGLDQFPAPTGKATNAHGNTIAGCTVRDARWAAVVFSGWGNLLADCQFYDCPQGVVFKHHGFAHEEGVTLQSNAMRSCTLMDCGGGAHAALTLETATNDANAERVMDTEMSDCQFIRSPGGPSLNRMVRIQAAGTRLHNCSIDIHSSDRQELNKQLIGVDVSSSSPASTSRISGLKLINRQGGAKNVYGVAIRGKQHDDLLLDGCELYNYAPPQGTKAVTASNTGYVRIRDLKSRGFAEAVHEENAIVNETGTDAR